MLCPFGVETLTAPGNWICAWQALTMSMGEKNGAKRTGRIDTSTCTRPTQDSSVPREPQIANSRKLNIRQCFLQRRNRSLRPPRQGPRRNGGSATSGRGDPRPLAHQKRQPLRARLNGIPAATLNPWTERVDHIANGIAPRPEGRVNQQEAASTSRALGSSQRRSTPFPRFFVPRATPSYDLVPQIGGQSQAESARSLS